MFIVGKIKKHSNRASLIIVFLLVATISSYAIGSKFSLNRASESGESVSIFIPSGEAMRVEVASEEAALAASDSAKAASAGLSPVGWIFSAATSGSSLENVAESAEIYAERMVVFTARIDLEVDDIDSTVEYVRLLTETYGGFVASVSTRSEGGAVTIRVPQAHFYDVVLDVEVLGDVVNRDLKGEDVTEDFVDLEARLSNLQAQEVRLLEILEMGTTVEDVLKVEKELERVRGEIEGITGELQYLESRVELATVTVLLNEAIEKQRAWLPQVDWGAPVITGLAILSTIIQGLLTLTIVAGPFIVVGLSSNYLYKRYKLSRDTSVESASKERAPDSE